MQEAERDRGLIAQAGALRPYVTPWGAWALALGCAIGWGSLVVTCNSYLLQAGPMGSILGLLAGALVMVVIARSYSYLANCFPSAGGAYTYSKEVFGHDFGFLTAWFLALTYFAMLWANATSVPLFARIFIGDVFRFGYLYTVFDYDVYLGEALMTVAAVAVFALVCAKSRRGALRLMVGLCVLLCACILAVLVGALAGFPASSFSLDPAFLPDSSALKQVALIATISPWAFIGFENVTHSAEEFTFSRNLTFRIMVAAIVTATVLYVAVFLLSTTAYPEDYASWNAYIADRGNLSGIEALPAFFTARHCLGDVGVALLMASLLALVITSLVGNTLALSRLICALAGDGVLPKRFACVSARCIPENAVFLVLAVSCFVPFLGRTAVGWIVDVTTIGATLVYGFVSASAAKVAASRGDRVERACGIGGVAVMVAFGANLVLMGFSRQHTLESESYFLFAVWGILGFLAFRFLLGRESASGQTRRFGRSTVVWIALLALVLFVSFTWMSESINDTADTASQQVNAYYDESAASEAQRDDQRFVIEQLGIMGAADERTIAVAAVLFALAAAMLLTNFRYMSKWAQDSERQLADTREVIYTDPLTGLPSMARFSTQALERAAVLFDSGERPCVLAFNLMGMKDYNARYGREAGDKLLRTFAEVLAESFGADSCARASDDHFCAIAAEGHVQQAVEGVFDRFEHVNRERSLPVRAGACPILLGEDAMKAGIERARTACDASRRTWQSHLSWFDESMSEEARLRMHILGHVDQAVAEGWVRPYYQAIIDARTGEVAVEEALARWIDPEYGFLSPGEFIPILEDAGLLYKVDMHMVDCVLADMAEKRQRGVPVVPVSINFSLNDLEQHDVARFVRERMDAAGVERSMIKVEFTESMASEDSAALQNALDTLHQAGIDAWMDDFGSGYSSLNSLKTTDFDLAKLDMEFLRDERGQRSWDIIAGVVRILRDLGMRSLVEGVETEVHVQRLKGLECDLLQGFYFARPQPLGEIIDEYLAGTGLPRQER